jgi:hypothetical protein
MPVSELKTEAEPAGLGLDPDRLRRLDRHFARYVDDGRLPGWLITVSRHGRLAYVTGYGSRDVEAGLPASTDTVWRIYSMTKPITCCTPNPRSAGSASDSAWPSSSTPCQARCCVPRASCRGAERPAPCSGSTRPKS